MKKNTTLSVGIVVIIIFVFSFMAYSLGNNIHVMTMDQKTEMFISLKDSIQKELRPQHLYRCCLKNSCTYCIEKTPEHGEEASCDCLKDVVEGKHPCGECIGEIVEGHGNPYLSKYFAKAIADETGHEDVLKQIIFEKYGTPVEDQY